MDLYHKTVRKILTFRISSQPLDNQWTTSVLQQKIAIAIIVGIQLLQLVDTALSCMPNGVQVTVAQASKEMNSRV